MFREVPNVQQKPDEPTRRWFFAADQDLLVWFGDDGDPVAFQLAYGKYLDEHAIRWKSGRGFMHHRVDDGEGKPTRNQSSMLVPDGVFQAESVLKSFLEQSGDIPREIVEFIAARLKEHPEYRDDT
jgi:hypothetical protein